MMDSLFFAGFDPLYDAPEKCTVCSSHPPVFTFDYREVNGKGATPKTKGFCCFACAGRLLKKLARAESAEWAEEEAALAQDDFDIAEFHKHRLEVFPGVGRK